VLVHRERPQSHKMNLAFDEFGRPFIIIREQKAKERVKGIEAIKVICCLGFAVKCAITHPLIVSFTFMHSLIILIIM
jgi:hypothetical protein